MAQSIGATRPNSPPSNTEPAALSAKKAAKEQREADAAKTAPPATRPGQTFGGGTLDLSQQARDSATGQATGRREQATGKANGAREASNLPVQVSGDLDGDGKPDLDITVSSDAGGAPQVRVAAGDVNGDGVLDPAPVKISNADGSRGQATVAKARVTTEGGGEIQVRVKTVGDLDGDGRADATQVHVRGDLDGDGKPDLNTSITVADLDRDGRPDDLKVRVATGDVDGDGKADRSTTQVTDAEDKPTTVTQGDVRIRVTPTSQTTGRGVPTKLSEPPPAPPPPPPPSDGGLTSPLRLV